MSTPSPVFTSVSNALNLCVFEQTQLEHEHKIVDEVYQRDVAEMRDLIQCEVKDLCRLAGMAMPEVTDLMEDKEDSFDLNQYVMNVDQSDAEAGPVVPLQYLQPSPE